MKTLKLLTALGIALTWGNTKAQITTSDWSININGSPYLFQGQIEQESQVSNYSYHTMFGVDFMKKISDLFAISISLDYTKAKANISPYYNHLDTGIIVVPAADSPIPINSFLTESYGAYFKFRFSPITFGILSPFVSAGFGFSYFTHESKVVYPIWIAANIVIPPHYSSQHIMVSFIPVEAGLLFNVYQLGNFQFGLDASVLAMYSLRRNVSFDQAGTMTQPISTGIITGLSIGW